MIATILLALSSPAAPVMPAPACPAGASVDRLAGRWTGDFGGADWTFELTRDGAAWSGRYQTSKSPAWRAVEALTVVDGCATFSLKSEPRLTFVLAADAGGTTLAGDLQIAGHVTLPFTAKRAA